MMTGWEVLTLLTLIWCAFLTLWRVVDAMTIANMLVAALNGRAVKAEKGPSKFSKWGLPIRTKVEPPEPGPRVDLGKFYDVVAALRNLGYSADQSRDAARTALQTSGAESTVELMLKVALRTLQPAKAES